MIALLLTAWAAVLFALNVRAERIGHEGTEVYHRRDELGERLGQVAWRLALVAGGLFVIAIVTHIIASATADGAAAALDVCRELGVTAWDDETTRSCLAYADSAAHGSSMVDVATAALWIAFAL